jgi:hypothetical protein
MGQDSQRRFDPLFYPVPERYTPPDVVLRPRISPPVKVSPEVAPFPLPPWLFPPALNFPVDLPVSRVPVLVPAAGSLIVTWPAIPQGATGVCRRIGLSTSDFANTRITTRINANPVPPFGGIVGAIGPLESLIDLTAPVIIRSGDVFSVLLENIGLAGITMMVRTTGWWY